MTTCLSPRTLPGIDWVKIAAGDFIYQEETSHSLPTFYMARNPVTNIQYQTFIDAGAYDVERWWKGLECTKPEASRWPQSERPCTSVNWYEAVAFSRWLSEQLGFEVRLPTEKEWERAARGRDGRAFPWGAYYKTGYANINETLENNGTYNLMQTTPVGAYPQGASSEGVLDLAGNVWDWCLNKLEPPDETKADTSGDPRMLRGGSWYGNPDAVRSAERNWIDPGVRLDNVGFRLVSSSGPIR